MTTVYISGASAELELVEELRDRLHLAGVDVLDSWMRAVRRARRLGKTDRDLSPLDASKHALDDFAAIEVCDVFWLVVPNAGTKSLGAWLELGFAIGTREFGGLHPSIVVSGDVSASIFTSHPAVGSRFIDHDTAARWIENLHRSGRS
jgi:hypothetical protein